jgi:hypothetical protein
MLLLVFLPFRFAWPMLRSDVRWATVLLTVVLVPLFIANCGQDELRNLSLLFPMWFVIGVCGVQALFLSAQDAPDASLASGRNNAP